MNGETIEQLMTNGGYSFMLYFAFGASAILTILRIFDYFLRIISRNTLDFRLTKELRVAINKGGECVLVTGVLVANDSGVLIEEATAELSKTGASEKNFKLELTAIGEKIRNDAGLPVDYFFSTSPIFFVPHNTPVRLVYGFRISHYAEQITRVLNEFEFNILKLKSGMNDTIPTDEPALSEYRENVLKVVDTATAQTSDVIQVEGGEYALKVSLKFRQKRRAMRGYRHKEVSSSIRFNVEEQVREYLRATLKDRLIQLAVNSLTGQSEFVEEVVYTPLDIREE